MKPAPSRLEGTAQPPAGILDAIDNQATLLLQAESVLEAALEDLQEAIGDDPLAWRSVNMLRSVQGAIAGVRDGLDGLARLRA